MLFVKMDFGIINFYGINYHEDNFASCYHVICSNFLPFNTRVFIFLWKFNHWTPDGPLTKFGENWIRFSFGKTFFGHHKLFFMLLKTQLVIMKNVIFQKKRVLYKTFLDIFFSLYKCLPRVFLCMKKRIFFLLKKWMMRKFIKFVVHGWYLLKNKTNFSALIITKN